jgi:thymidine phosphorylase
MINKISKNEALLKINKVLDNGKAAEKFEMMVNALGGSKSFLSTYEKELSHNMYAEDINLGKDGWVKEMKTRELGLLLIELGGGRKQVNDQINYHVGYENVLGVGSVIEASTPVIKVLANSKDDFDRVKELIKSCFIISDQEVKKSLNIYEVVK